MKNTSLILRTCRSDMTSRNGFKWSEVGKTVTAPDFKATQECGNGLHGWLYGQGDYTTSPYLGSDAKWLVIEVETDSIIMLGGKCKFESGIVRFIGDRKSATDYLMANEPKSESAVIIGATKICGDNRSATVGALGTAIAGDSGTATAGDNGSATAGDSGTATAGDRGTAIAGYHGTATAGDNGSATAGDRGTATAGHMGEIRLQFYDSEACRYRTKIGYIGEDGLLPNVAYQLDGERNFKAVLN